LCAHSGMVVRVHRSHAPTLEAVTLTEP
jgi:hypothetical protein